MDRSDELLCCPFCGLQPQTYWDDVREEEGYNINCDCIGDIHIHSIFREDAVEKWNKRVSGG